MNVKIAAVNTGMKIDDCYKLPDCHPEFGKDHLRYMVNEIALGKVEGEKAHRWLGWLQANVCAGGGASLEELKLINKNA